MLSLRQPFDKNKFNFTKINMDKEIIFKMEKDGEQKEKENVVTINVAPLEYGSSLILPDLHGGHPQIMTLDAVRLSIQTMLLSRDSTLKIGFNSLCAFASVNHLHMHMLYIKVREGNVFSFSKMTITYVLFAMILGPKSLFGACQSPAPVRAMSRD